MPSKKNKGDQKDDEPLKPLGHYAKDRLELTKQLFSCLKKKQIKSRLPVNLQKKSIERIQQICLDEILGISTKRLLSIINNTVCPNDTESDSEIEHISLSEISSDSDIEETFANDKESLPEKAPQKTAGPPPKKTEKEMTMLELLELQARARAIRSQLALEPVTKIELNDSEEEATTTQKESTSKEPATTSKSKTPEVPKSSSNEKNDKRVKIDQTKKPETSKSASVNEKNDKRGKKDVNKEPKKSTARKSPEHSRRVQIVREKSPKKSEPEKPKASAPPVKLKRNFRGTELEGYPLSILKLPPLKEKTPPKENDESRSSSPDVITMEQNIATYFISDSDDEKEEQPPAKKQSPSPKIIVQSIEIIPPLEQQQTNEPESESKQQEPAQEIEKEEGEIEEDQPMEVAQKENDDNDKNSQTQDENIESQQNDSQEKDKSTESTQQDDDDVVNIMSDTEIDLNGNSDKEEIDEEPAESSQNEMNENKSNTDTHSEKVDKQASQSDYDDDVVEINNSDNELLDSAKTSDESETWEQRYLRSSNVKNVLKTSKLATKVRDKLVQNKRTHRAAKKEKEKEKQMSEKISKLEEGSMEQFEVLKESSNSNL